MAHLSPAGELPPYHRVRHAVIGPSPATRAERQHLPGRDRPEREQRADTGRRDRHRLGPHRQMVHLRPLRRVPVRLLVRAGLH